MKRNDEGYVLILVLVVMIVLSLVAASVLTVSLRNLQNQQASLERMQDKYTAQGRIEQKVSEITKLLQPGAETPVEITGTAENINETTLRVTFTETEKSVKITCIIEITADNIVKVNDTYTLTNPTSYQYTGYEITYQEVPDETK